MHIHHLFIGEGSNLPRTSRTPDGSGAFKALPE